MNKNTRFAILTLTVLTVLTTLLSIYLTRDIPTPVETPHTPSHKEVIAGDAWCKTHICKD